MTLQVIGAGLGRTGTLSLKFALEYLGFDPCYHMEEVLADGPNKIPQWTQVVNGRQDWEAIFEGYAATVDYPGCYYWRSLAAAYPNAKIILSRRDPESWFRSVNETIFSPHMLGMIDHSPAKAFFAGSVLADFGEHIADHDFMVAYFERWNQAVIDAVLPERLLVFEARQGWEPLCAFLGVAVPTIAYPRVNSREQMLDLVGADHPPSAEPPSFEAIGAMLKQRLAAQREAAFAGVSA
ncbi:MAG TPA: sulfotransferase [Sphingobium sp.]|nr:sulfotransferase [Sphingobium sp.]